MGKERLPNKFNTSNFLKDHVELADQSYDLKTLLRKTPKPKRSQLADAQQADRQLGVNVRRKQSSSNRQLINQSKLLDDASRAVNLMCNFFKFISSTASLQS